jgi:Cu+-exporting ATPase
MADAHAVPSSRCLGCGQEVDALRAAHVAILDGRFYYFCRAECRRDYVHAQATSRQDAERSPPADSGVRVAADESSSAVDRSSDLDRADGGASSQRRPKLPRAAVARSPSRPSLPEWVRELPLSRAQRRKDVFAAADAAGIALGVLVLPIGLLGSTADAARLPLAVLSWAALVLRIAVLGRDVADPHPLVVLAPTTGALFAACWASAIRDPHAAALAVFAGLSCAAAIVGELLLSRARARVEAASEAIERELDVRVCAAHGDTQMEVPASEVRPGEQIVVETGELVGVDGAVVAGEARTIPFLGARLERTLQQGDSIFAGARVVSGRLLVTATRSGANRSWIRLLSPRATRIDVASPMVRTVRLTIERGAPLAAVVVGVAALAANATPVEVLAAACAAAMAFGAKPACSFAALHFARAHLEALSRGIAYKDARSFERAGATNLAVLTARGTVLMGEPEIVAVIPVGAVEIERLLSLAAGAETGQAHPVAAAVLRAARMRGVAPDHVRNIAVHSGLGITAVASTGERLVVGGRALLLEQKIGVAATEHGVPDLEARGRSVLLVALGDRLIGVIALQDGLRPGARAAVQRLLDARIEPVLLSGEARDTCETIGRALDIEHVRPEVLPSERSAAVRALAEGGNVVAVIGQAADDESALGAADVAVAMGTAGSITAEWSIVLANDDVRDAAFALAIAHAARDRARVAIALGATPGLVALLGIGVGIAPPVAAALAMFVSTISAAAHAREAALSP